MPVSSDVRFESCPLGYDLVDGGAWVGAFPGGPLVHLNAVSFEILMIVVESASPVTADHVVALLRERMDGVPSDAEQIVGAVLNDFADRDLVRSVPMTMTGGESADD